MQGQDPSENKVVPIGSQCDFSSEEDEEIIFHPELFCATTEDVKLAKVVQTLDHLVQDSVLSRASRKARMRTGQEYVIIPVFNLQIYSAKGISWPW